MNRVQSLAKSDKKYHQKRNEYSRQYINFAMEVVRCQGATRGKRFFRTYIMSKCSRLPPTQDLTRFKNKPKNRAMVKNVL